MGYEHHMQLQCSPLCNHAKAPAMGVEREAALALLLMSISCGALPLVRTPHAIPLYLLCSVMHAHMCRVCARWCHRLMRSKLSQARLATIIGEAVEIERSFLCDALPVDLIGMNANLMEQYIQFVADRLMVALDADKLYNAANPFDWMELLSLQCVPSLGTLSPKPYSRIPWPYCCPLGGRGVLGVAVVAGLPLPGAVNCSACLGLSGSADTIRLSSMHIATNWTSGHEADQKEVMGGGCSRAVFS